MVGAIIKRDILAHPVVTIRCFGWSVFIRALLAGPRPRFFPLADRNARPAAGGRAGGAVCGALCRAGAEGLSGLRDASASI